MLASYLLGLVVGLVLCGIAYVFVHLMEDSDR